MANVILRSRQQILGQMIAEFLDNTDVNDLFDGSVTLTILEAASTSDFSQEGKLLQLLAIRDVEKASGTDLENLATELGVTPSRIGSESSTVLLRIFDTAFSKVATTIYA